MQKMMEKIERRLGERLFIKGARCIGPKCAVVRRNYPPGMRSKKRRRRNLSEYAELFREKQKVRYLYGLDDKSVERYSKKATSEVGIFSANFIRLVERRLDNTVFRLGLTESRRTARQAVSHGHILVNGRSVTIPSYLVSIGDVITPKPTALSSAHFDQLEIRIKKYDAPIWLTLDREKNSGTVAHLPDTKNVELTSDVTKVKEFYSR